MIGLDVEFSPSAQIIGRDLSNLARGFRTYRVPLRQSVDHVMIPAIAHQFEVGGDPPWEPLAASTVERREAQGTMGGEPQDILVETGTLFSAVTARARWTFTPDEAYFSNMPTRAEYGVYHQLGFGNARGGGFVPARPFVRGTDEDVDAVEDIFSRWANGMIIVNWLKRAQRFL